MRWRTIIDGESLPGSMRSLLDLEKIVSTKSRQLAEAVKALYDLSLDKNDSPDLLKNAITSYVTTVSSSGTKILDVIREATEKMVEIIRDNSSKAEQRQKNTPHRIGGEGLFLCVEL